MIELNAEMQSKLCKWATRGLSVCCELRGQKQQSGTSTDKKDASKKNEFHYLELSLEVLATGDHIKADFFGPRDHKGPLELIPAPRGSVLVCSFNSFQSDFNGTKGRVKEFEILHKASAPSFSYPEPANSGKVEKVKV